MANQDGCVADAKIMNVVTSNEACRERTSPAEGTDIGSLGMGK